MSAIGDRWRTNLKTAITLARGGVRLSSIVAYPLRHRLHLDNRLTLRDGTTLRAPAREPLLSLFNEVWTEGNYLHEPEAMAGGAIVDVGAHVGTFTVWAARNWPEARIVAVEPSASSREYLRGNIAANGLRNVTVVEAACGGQDGEVELHARGPAARNTIYRTDNYGSSFTAIGKTKVITLDRLFADYAIERCALLKLDCEGAEYEVLDAASGETMARIERIAMEYHTGMNEHRPERLAEHLAACGFTVDLRAPLDEEGGYLLAARH